MANNLGVSVITTKRAYSDLEFSGYIYTVPGKGSFVAALDGELLREEQLKRIEQHLAQSIDQAQLCGVELSSLHDMLDALAEP